MAKPSITKTTHILPFEKLSPSDFEQLCLAVIEREGYLRPQHLGAAGSEQGRDITAYKSTGQGEKLWYFQCKRYKKIDTPTFTKEIDKYNQLVKQSPALGPIGIVFITNAIVSSNVRQAVRDYCDSHGYQCDFWAQTELDMYVNKYPDIVNKFFNANMAIPILHQLPPPPHNFTGRQNELIELITSVEQKAQKY